MPYGEIQQKDDLGMGGKQVETDNLGGAFFKQDLLQQNPWDMCFNFRFLRPTDQSLLHGPSNVQFIKLLSAV